jgi:nucleoid DNA-binding protein
MATIGQPWIKEQILHKELVREVANRSGIGQKECRKVLTALYAALKDHIFKLNYVALPGFGAFFTKKQKARLMVLRSGEKIWTSERLAAKFIFFEKFKHQIRTIKIDDLDNRNLP